MKYVYINTLKYTSILELCLRLYGGRREAQLSGHLILNLPTVNGPPTLGCNNKKKFWKRIL